MEQGCAKMRAEMSMSGKLVGVTEEDFSGHNYLLSLFIIH